MRLAAPAARLLLIWSLVAGSVAACRPDDGAPAPSSGVASRLVPAPTGAAAASPAATLAAAPTGAPAAAPASPQPIAALFPDEKAVPGWAPEGDVQTWEPDNLLSLVDGSAEGYLVYGFQQVGVRHYASDGKPALKAEIWRMGSAADAYGLYSTAHSGAPIQIGNNGVLDAGQQITFWQSQYLVRVRAGARSADADLQALARALAQLVPQGGQPPALLALLPAGRVADSEIFFRQELSIQDRVWLGGENLLGLGPATEGVLADYELGGASVTLFLVRYPQPEQATAAVSALRAGSISELQTARANANVLGAIFGQSDGAAAETLLTAALR